MSKTTSTLDRKEQLKRELALIEAEERKASKQAKKNYLVEKDVFVKEAVSHFLELHEILKKMKSELFEKGEKLNAEMFSIFDREPKEAKNFSITTECKTMKLSFERSDRFSFNETAMPGIELMHEVLKNKFESRNKTMYGIIEELLSKNGQGDYDPKMLVKLRRHAAAINDANFDKALDILSQAQEITASSLYVRAYLKDVKTGKWKDITLQFSAV